METNTDINLYSKNLNKKFFTYKLIFMNFAVTLSFFKLPYMILALIIIIALEYFILNYFWKDSRLSFLVSFIGNIFSSLVAFPLLLLPLQLDSLWTHPVTIGEYLFSVIFQTNLNSRVYFTGNIFSYTLGTLIVFGIICFLTIIFEFIVFLLFKTHEIDKYPLIYSNIVSYTFIMVFAFLLGIVGMIINSTGTIYEVFPNLINTNTYSESLEFLKISFILFIILLILNVVLIVLKEIILYILKIRKKSKVQSI